MQDAARKPMASEGKKFADPAYTNGYEFASGTGYALPEYPFVAPPEILTGQVKRCPIVIVGAGMSGLTLACALARLGIEAVLLDEDNSVGVKGASSRGICYTQKSLEIFQNLGIYERIAQRGVQWSVGRTFAGHDEVYSFDLQQQGAFKLSAQPPFINIQQFYIEGFLVERIAQLGGIDLRWKSRVTAFAQNEDCARLTVQTPAGSYQLEAEHIIDASGSHTPFHAWTGVGMQQRQGDDRWCIADVRFNTRPPVERHTWIEAPFNDNRAVWQHLMADDVWRIDYQMPPGADPQEVSREDVVRERLAKQFGPDVAIEIVWVGPYAYRSLCLHSLRKGRVFFVGDTAKVVSPFGARGGNSGIADAHNLAWKLAAVQRGWAMPALLDSYNDERLEAAQHNVQVTDRTTRFLRPAHGMEQVFRQAAIGLAKQHQGSQASSPYMAARQFINTGRMAIANPYSRSRACGSGGGLSVQNTRFEWPKQDNMAVATTGSIHELLQWAGGRLLLLVFGELSKQTCERLQALTSTSPLRAVQVVPTHGRAQALEHVRDPQGHVQAACHVFGHAWALLRPDAYVAATGESVDASVVRALERALALPHVEPSLPHEEPV